MNNEVWTFIKVLKHFLNVRYIRYAQYSELLLYQSYLIRNVMSITQNISTILLTTMELVRLSLTYFSTDV